MTTLDCGNCKGQIELTGEFEKPGTQFLCPHCKELTMVPKGKRISKGQEKLLMENWLDGLAVTVFIISAIIAGLFLLDAMFNVVDATGEGEAAIPFLSAIAIMTNGIFWRIIIRVFAEIIRLLRKISERG